MSLRETVANFKSKPSSSESRPFMILRPGGNDTALVKGVVTDPLTKRRVNQLIMESYPSVEQVGFVDLSEPPELMMAGGEFCGNATRSTAWLALGGTQGEALVKVSGVENKLIAGAKGETEAFAQIPIYPEFSRIKKDTEKNGYIVQMEGITHFVCFDTQDIEGQDQEQIKRTSLEAIKDRGLDRFPAAGVIYAKQNQGNWQITPIVFVRDIATLFYETACGSGTTALGMVLALNEGKSVENIAVFQPSGLPINVTVRRNSESFDYAEIRGPIVPLLEGSLEGNEKMTYIIERVYSSEQMNQALKKEGLIELYKKVFAGPPYFESFNDQEIQGYFQEYLADGIVYLARNGKKIIGFGACVSLESQKTLAELARKNGIDPKNVWYMADLGVDSEYRENGIGKRLVESRIQAVPEGSEIIMRTSENNIASKNLYLSLGFEEVIGMEQEVEQERIGGVLKRDRRIFLKRRK